MKNKIIKALAVSATLLASPLPADRIELLNVSYDPTRELYREYNKVFAEKYKAETGHEVTVRQSHGGSGSQGRSVVAGNPADIVSLALALDIDDIVRKGKLIDKDWITRYPHNSSPYTSTIIFLVRKGNPKGIRNWDDLVKPGVEIITPNPKTGGGSRWNYLAAWGYVIDRELGEFPLENGKRKVKSAELDAKLKIAEAKATEFVSKLYKNVKVLDSGARGSTTTFLQRGIGDVLLAWENEAILAVNELKRDDVEIVVPKISILCEPSVSVVDKNVRGRGPTVEAAAKAYVAGLFTPEAQKIIARYGYRPSEPQHADPADLERFAKLKLFRLDELYRNWPEAQRTHFVDGAIFDRIYTGK